MARREYGTGGLTQRKRDGMWIGTIEAGWTADGKRRRVTVSSKDKATARRKLRDKKLQIERDGLTDVSARDTVKAWAERWLPIVERTLAPNAYATTASAVQKWIIPTIGHKRFDALNPGDIRALATAQADAGRSSSTQRRTHSVLMSLLRAAVVEGYPVPLRLLEMKAPKLSVNDRTNIEVLEALAILREAAALPHGSRWAAAFLQGLRQGEALGLTWDAVDLERGLMTIDWQLQTLQYKVTRDRTSGFRVPEGYEARHLRGAVHLVRPKSGAGYRVIPMVPWMRDTLTAWRDKAPENPHGLVWPNPDGTPRYYKADDAEWYALQAAAGVHHPTRVDKDGNPAPYTGHETRHTTATLLLECGVDPAVVIAIMGHSAILTTRGYQHVNAGPALDGLNRVAERLQLT